MLERADFGFDGDSLWGHMIGSRALSSQGEGAGKTNLWTCGIASCHVVQRQEKQPGRLTVSNGRGGTVGPWQAGKEGRTEGKNIGGPRS